MIVKPTTIANALNTILSNRERILLIDYTFFFALINGLRTYTLLHGP